MIEIPIYSGRLYKSDNLLDLKDNHKDFKNYVFR